MQSSSTLSKNGAYEGKKKYVNLFNSLHKIECLNQIYFYCKCKKVNAFFNDTVILVICKDLTKQQTSIYLKCKKTDLTYSPFDHQLIKKSDEIDLSIVKQYTLQQTNKMKISFKSTELQDWNIIFDKKQTRQAWYDLMLEKVNEVKNLALQKSQLQIKTSQQEQICKQERQNQEQTSAIRQSLKKEQIVNKTIQIKREQISYTTHTQINYWMNTHLYRIKSALHEYLCQSKLNKLRLQSQFINKASQFETDLIQLGKLISQQYEKTTNLQTENKVKGSTILELQIKNSQHQRTVSQLQSTVSQLQNKTIQLQTQNKQLLNQHQQLKGSNHSLNAKLEADKQRQKGQKNSMIQQHKRQLNQTTESYEKIITNLNEKIQIFEQAKLKHEQSKRQEEQAKSDQERTIASKYRQYEEKLEVLKRNQEYTQKDFKQRIIKVQTEKKQMKAQIYELKLQVIFQGGLLQLQSANKQYIKKTIESYRDLQITQTKLLYKYDKQNKVNFHSYIDEHPNILLILKTVKGALIAAYSKDPFSLNPTQISSCGIIMSLNNKKSFYVEPHKRSVSYDEYYIIYGNSEIRIKSQEELIFSNFGIANSYFNSEGKKVDILLAEDNNREVPLETYQIYQLKFDG